MQLRQTELVGTVHDDGVGGGNVNAGLDDGGAQQHVEALLVEVAHDPFQLALGHLAMGHLDARLGNQLGQHLPTVLDGAHLVVQEVDLTAALEFAQHGLADGAAGFLAHESADGQTFLRCGGNDGEVADALQAHGQRARDGRGGEREHVDLGAQVLQRFFLAHAEAVLLVDDHQAQVAELHVLGQQLVGADDDVDLAALDAFQGVTGGLGRSEAGQFGHVQREAGEAVVEGLEMLLGQQRGGGEHGDLATGAGGHVGSAQGHLGLAEAHVAADQTVHRLGRDQILHDGMDGSLLVGRFLEAEAFGKGCIAGRVELEGMSGSGGAAGIEIQQLNSGVTRLLGCLAARLVPLAGAQRVQRGVLGRSARVAADEVQHGHRHVQRGIVGVGQVQEFGRAFTQVDVDQPHVAADAMLGMHDRIASLEFGQVADEGVDLGGLALVALALAHEGGEELAFGDDQQRTVHKAEAPLQRTDSEHHGGVGGHRGLPVFGRGHLQAGFGKEFLQRLAPAQRLGNDQALLGGASHKGGRIQHVAQRADGIVLAAVDRHVGHSDSMDGACAPAISPGFTPFGACGAPGSVIAGGSGICARVI